MWCCCGRATEDYEGIWDGSLIRQGWSKRGLVYVPLAAVLFRHMRRITIHMKRLLFKKAGA